MTVGEVVKASTDFLARKDVPSPRVDAEHLVAHALAVTRLDLYLQYDRPLTDEETAACRELVRRRGTREPLAYILGEWGFRRLMLNVDSRALIPRPETEVVVERCLALLDGVDAPGGARRRHGHGRDRARHRGRAAGRGRDSRSTSRRTPSRLRARTRTGRASRIACRSRATTSRTGCRAARTTSSCPTRRTSSPAISARSSRKCATGSPSRRSSGTA